EAMMAQKIVTVQHHPSAGNKVADGLSRKWTDFKGKCSNGEDYAVDPGWELTHGIMNNMMALKVHTADTALRTRFATDPYFSEVIEWLEEGQLSHTSDKQSKCCAHRQSHDFMIEDGKLWWVARRRQAWHVPHVECILGQETFEHVVHAHATGGHFGRDQIVLTLQQTYYWHSMQHSTVEVI
ncbi:hypothetical protein K439DRAFT_1280367, partial [Ramaria rubella]